MFPGWLLSQSRHILFHYQKYNPPCVPLAAFRLGGRYDFIQDSRKVLSVAGRQLAGFCADLPVNGSQMFPGSRGCVGSVEEGPRVSPIVFPYLCSNHHPNPKKKVKMKSEVNPSQPGLCNPFLPRAGVADEPLRATASTLTKSAFVVEHFTPSVLVLLSC